MDSLITLREPNSLPADPWPVFENWVNAGLALQSGHPDAIALGTINANGAPAVRFVLHKGMNHRAIQFVTNFQSTKAQDLERDSRAAVTYYWKEISRQIRVEGTVTRATAKESDDYWNSRTRESQIGAWASDQSKEITGREALDLRVEQLTKKFADAPIPRPTHWGMLELHPRMIEFLHLQSGRLHDRVLYTMDSAGKWSRKVLAP